MKKENTELTGAELDEAKAMLAVDAETSLFDDICEKLGGYVATDKQKNHVKAAVIGGVIGTALSMASKPSVGTLIGGVVGTAGGAYVGSRIADDLSNHFIDKLLTADIGFLCGTIGASIGGALTPSKVEAN